jgi:hypothetical protein
MPYMPTYISEDGTPIPQPRGLWDRLFGYQPDYKTSPRLSSRRLIPAEPSTVSGTRPDESREPAG